MNLIFWASRPHHSRGSIAHLVTKPCYETEKSVTKPVTKPILRVTKLGFHVTKPRDETTKFVTKPVTKPLFFRPTLSSVLRNRYATPQNPMFHHSKVEGIA